MRNHFSDVTDQGNVSNMLHSLEGETMLHPMFLSFNLSSYMTSFKPLPRMWVTWPSFHLLRFVSTFFGININKRIREKIINWDYRQPFFILWILFNDCLQWVIAYSTYFSATTVKRNDCSMSKTAQFKVDNGIFIWLGLIIMKGLEQLQHVIYFLKKII